eukprot:15484610-Alexandrium_andersonii.AAC.1
MAVGCSKAWRAARSQKIWNCSRCSKLELRSPEPASELIPEAPEVCILRHCSRRRRICRRNSPAGTPQ